MLVHANRQAAIVATTQRSREKTQSIWKTLCQSLGADATLTGVDPRFHVRYLELFGIRYRKGDISKSHLPVRAHTVEVALSDVGALFTSLDLPDPRMQPGTSTYTPALKKWLIAIHKQDPASSRVYPCNITILKAAFRLPKPSPGQLHARHLNLIGYFYLNRPGEVLKSPNSETSRSSPFRLCDVEFLSPTGRLYRIDHSPAVRNDVQTRKNRHSSLVYTDQKNGIKGEKITHVPTGDDRYCPVRALEHVVLHLLEHNAPLDTPLYTYYTYNKKTKQYKQSAITPYMSTKLLKACAANVFDITGIPPEKISSRSLCPGGATALLCAGNEPTNVALIGRWRSEAMLRYLRTQASPAVRKFALQMLQHAASTFNPATVVSDDDDDTLTYDGIPLEAPANLRDRFDPTDDVDDDDTDTDVAAAAIPAV